MILTYYQAIELMTCLPVLLTPANSEMDIDPEMYTRRNDELLIDKLPVFKLEDLAQFYPYMQDTPE